MDATVKNVTKKDNVYTATMVANKGIKTDEINVYVEISDEAQNYEQGSELIGSAEVIHVQAEVTDDQNPQVKIKCCNKGALLVTVASILLWIFINRNRLFGGS